MDWNHIFQTTIEGVAAATAIALAPILVQWAISQAKKIGLQVSADQQARLEYLTKQAILRTEEWAAKRVGGANGPAKLRATAESVSAVAGVSEDTAIDTIHSVLPTMGLGAAVKAASPLAPDPAK